MDLVTRGVSANDAEHAALDTVVARRLLGDRSVVGDSSRSGLRHLLLPCLHALQDRIGWISAEAVDEIAVRLDIAPAEVYGVASFYALLALDERPALQVHACIDLACRAKGVTESTLPDGVHPAACLGLCDQAPAALVTTASDTPTAVLLGDLTPADMASLRVAAQEPASGGLADLRRATPQARSTPLHLLGRVGVVDPTSLDAYRVAGGYDALTRAIALGRMGVIDAVNESGLIGRGGAGFPTGRKWGAVAGQPVTPHHLVCNADESEPGTFKDRVLMEGDPFAVIEAMTIAAFATGCEHGWIYLRAEYPRAYERLDQAIRGARSAGLLGDNILGAGFSFDVEIFRGAGAYICGEETAIFNSIEGYRGEPRNKPPFPVEVGLFGKPTLVNNVETLVNVLPILTLGPTAYRAIGTAGSAGSKLFCLSGAVRRPGVYEVSFGATLRELIEMAGGLPDGRTIQAVLLGGAAGGFVGPADLDLELTFESTRAAGATIGSGVVMVLDDTVDIVDQLLRIAAFFRHESCGQCVPCRVGTVRQHEALQRLAAGGRGGDVSLLGDLARVMRDASICGLGQTAANAIDSAVARLGVFS